MEEGVIASITTDETYISDITVEYILILNKGVKRRSMYAGWVTDP